MTISPLSNNLSIDIFLKSFRDGRIAQKVPVFYYHALIFWGVGITYFDSIFRKLASPLWLKGLGMWLPSSSLHVSIFPSQWVLDQEWLVYFFGYLTLLFEVLMIFIFWFKPFRMIVLAIGLTLHLGILISFPIPYFALGICGVYLLLLPTGLWRKFTPWQNKFTNVDLAKSQNLKLWVLSAGFCILLMTQFYYIVNAPLLKNRLPAKFYKIINFKFGKTFQLITKFTGIYSHGVFLDIHFENYNHVFSIEASSNGKIYWIPISDFEGRPSDLSSGTLFGHWAYRVVTRNVNSDKLMAGIHRYSYFWTKKQGLDPSDTIIHINMKEYDTPQNWEKGFLTNQIQKPWKRLASFRADDFEFKLPDLNFESQSIPSSK